MFSFVPLIENKQFCIQHVQQCFSVRLEVASQGLHKAHPSDVQNSFTETHAIDVRPTTAVNATNTYFSHSLEHTTQWWRIRLPVAVTMTLTLWDVVTSIILIYVSTFTQPELITRLLKSSIAYRFVLSMHRLQLHRGDWKRRSGKHRER